MSEEVKVPAALDPGPHEISVGIVDPRTEAAAVRLANAGRAADGWLPVGTQEVEGK